MSELEKKAEEAVGQAAETVKETVKEAAGQAAETVKKTAEEAAGTVEKTVKEAGKTTGRKKKEKVKKTVGQEILSWVLTIAVAFVIAFVVRALVFEPVRVDGESMLDTLQNGEIMFVTKFDYSSTWFSFPWQNATQKENAARFTFGGNPKRFDVVVCRYPGRGDTNFVKRVVGLPGDTVALTGGYLYVNGEKYGEPYISDAYRTGSRNELSDFKVPSKGDPLTIDSDGTLKVNGEAWPWQASRLSGKAENGSRLLYYYDSVDKKQVLQLNGKDIKSAEKLSAITGVEFKLENDFYFVMGDHRNNSNDSRAQGPIDRTMIVGHVQQVVYPFNAWRGIPNGLDVKK